MNYLSPRIEQPCMIWGAGIQGRGRRYEYQTEINFTGFIDSAPQKSGTTFHGLPVFSPDILEKDHPLILVSPKNEGVQREIFKTLASYGYVRNRDCFSSIEILDYIRSRESLNELQTLPPVKETPRPLTLHFSKEENPVVIMMASNHHYADMAGVAIASIKNHRNRNRVYEIHLCHTELQQDKINLLETLSEDGFMVTCENISSHIQEISHMFRSFIHISKETYYRLLIPTLFPLEDNVLYLDCDLVTLTDVAPLYDLDLSSYSVAVGKEWRDKDYNDYVANEVGMPHDVDFNAGVMVFNVPFWKKNDLLTQCKKVVEKLAVAMPYIGTVSIYHDQTILNLVCNNSYFRFDYRWNTLTWFANRVDDPLISKEDQTLINDVYCDPWIFHYAGETKPWEELSLENAHHFWSVARDTIFYEELFKNLLESHLKKEAYFRRKVNEQEMKSQFLNYIKNL